MLKIDRLLQPITAIAIVVCTSNMLLPARANPVSVVDRSTATAPKPAIDNTAKTPSDRSQRISAADKVETVSGAAEIALAEYLTANNVKFYGAFWCSHCKEQKALFGAVAASKLNYIECDKNGENSQRQLCKDQNIQMFPTWAIKGQFLPGTRDLKQLAELTGYQGATNFKYKKK
jgi:glutaredoxin